MKKTIVGVLAAVMLLCACGSEPDVPSASVEYRGTSYTINTKIIEEKAADISVLQQEEAHTYKGILLKDALAELEINADEIRKAEVTKCDGGKVEYTNEELLDADKLYVVFECDSQPITAEKDGKSTEVFSVVAADEIFDTNISDKIDSIKLY